MLPAVDCSPDGRRQADRAGRGDAGRWSAEGTLFFLHLNSEVFFQREPRSIPENPSYGPSLVSRLMTNSNHAISPVSVMTTGCHANQRYQPVTPAGRSGLYFHLMIYFCHTISLDFLSPIYYFTMVDGKGP